MRLAPQLMLAALVLAATAAGVVWLIRGSPDRGIEIVLPAPTATPFVQVKAYITGAVHEPGVYALTGEPRLADLVQAAGGALEESDLSAVNLAARIEDEDHWHIPLPGESTHLERSAEAASDLIDINSAEAARLVDLPRIGETIAKRIVEYREANGPFSSVEELLLVQGIGPATLAGIRELIEAR